MEPFIHALIPALILLAFFPKLEKKYIFYLLPIVWIIDLDLYIGTLHRFLFHNIFFVLLVAGLLYLIWDKKAAIVGGFYGFSHILFDLTYPGVAFLYPLYQKTVYVTAQVLSKNGWIFNFNIGGLTQEDYVAAFESIEYATWISEQPILIGVLILLVLIYFYRKKITSFFSAKP